MPRPGRCSRPSSTTSGRPSGGFGACATRSNGKGREPVSGPEPEREWVIRFLDDLRAAEAASAEVLAAWIAVCAFDGLRGGLRVIAEREAAHAGLLPERLGELGVPPRAALAESMRAAALQRLGSERVSDEQKLATLLARHPAA